ncbi:Eco57I restriction-modification methylase domain-containing protein [Planktothrix sp. FACHB-1365]|uniref:Eco57I restriction-modification methylase domain-containing protein n=1 Tax=Planktothrix sp. FACHB-1365 TaxID=2692855 RepID=UPI0016884848|nr:Eco57I restriction-modification methylase domain-containing protein [Planktothrix sp. FACHB-1365]MBD2483954.1 Eco57I restriction-modification methylase domain-containing protein [Planktothrix sp. FACHB-1365]
MSLNLTSSQIQASKPIQYSSNTAFLNEVDLLRLRITPKIDKVKQQKWGQFFTPFPVADLMARMFQNLNLPEISLLDAGAGMGSLSAAFVSIVCQQPKPPDSLRIIAYEIDPSLKEYLKQTLELCTQQCESYKISLHWEIRTLDFIEEGVNQLQPNLFSASENLSFTHAIINPPYFKINAHSKYRSLLRSINLETSNIYPGFIQVATQLLTDGGELVAITPRSFCNGLYFREFRKRFLRDMALRQVHLFDSRLLPFNDQAVLQETMIFSAIKQVEKESTVLINSSCSADDDLIRTHTVPYTTVVHPDDPEQFIRIVPDAYSQEILEQMASFQCTLLDLGLCVSTGRVVDFRAKEYLRLLPEAGTVPLIYPVHCSKGYLEYPTSTQKHQALVQTEQTANLLLPNEHYVLTRRFSAKEEKKRVVAVVYDANSLNSQWVGFENHLNYFHHQGKGLSLCLARGLTAYLNSTLVDSFFRLFNGNTQVNATDLRNLKYPTLKQLLELGEKIGNSFPSQQTIDELIQQDILKMTNSRESNSIIRRSLLFSLTKTLSKSHASGSRSSQTNVSS